MFKSMRDKSTRYLAGELVSWLIGMLGLLFLFYGSWGFTSVDLAVDTAVAVRNSAWAMGTIFMVIAIIYGYLNWSTERSKNKITHFSFRFFGFLTLFIVFGYQIILITSNSFIDGLTQNTAWLVLQSIIAATIVIFGILHVSANIDVKPELKEKSKRKDKKEDKKEEVVETTTDKKEYSDEDLQKIVEILKQDKAAKEPSQEEKEKTSDELKLW